MAIKLIALDLDDTLLGKDLKISEGNRRALMKAQEAGITLVLASGRPEAGMRVHAETLELPLRDGWIISYNGGRISRAQDHSPFWEKSLTREEALVLYDLSWREGLNFVTYDGKSILTPEVCEYCRVEQTLTGLPVEEKPDLRFHLPPNLPKVILMEHPEVLKAKLPLLKKEWGHRWHITLSKPFFMEFTPFAIEKGAALARLCEYLEILPEEVLALGDGMNDAGMLQWAGLGVAMANASEEVKVLAKAVTGHHDEDGVAEAVERYCLSTVSRGISVE